MESISKHLNQSCSNCNSVSDSVFCTLNKSDLSILDQGKNSNLYKKGQAIFLEGNPPFGLYCINSGKIKLVKTSSAGEETIVRIASTGDLLGHRSLFSDSPYTSSAMVVENSMVCFISKSTILSLVKSNPSLSFEIISYLSNQMGASEEKIASLIQKDLKGRFSELLLLLKETYGENVGGGKVKINIKLTREEMASMIGAATENTIRMVTEFKKDKLIELNGKYIYLLNLREIERRADIRSDY